MDKYLINVKEATNLLEKLNIPLLKSKIVYYTLKYLPQKYDILKHVILSKTLPTFWKLNLQLLVKRLAKKKSLERNVRNKPLVLVSIVTLYVGLIANKRL
jgi:hypothetical protein